MANWLRRSAVIMTFRAQGVKADFGEVRPLGWGFAGSDELKRGGTAPGPPERETATNVVKAPSSSYKYSVQSMGHSHITPVSLKPSGYQSKLEAKPRSYMRPTESSGHKFTVVRAGMQPYGQEANSVPWPEVPKSAFLQQEEFKRPRPHFSEAECSDRSVHKPCESGYRPPSRHKPSPKAVGLELPPRPITPPESGIDSFFDKTWSFAFKRLEEETEEAKPDKSSTHARDNGRPKSQKKLLGSLEQGSTLLAWDDRAKPRTSYEKAPKSTLDPEKHSKGDIPITVTKTGIPIEGSEFIFIRRRLQTADTGASKGWTPKIATGKNLGTGRVREDYSVRNSLESDHFGHAE